MNMAATLVGSISVLYTGCQKVGVGELKKSYICLETKYNKNSNKSNCFDLVITQVIAKLNGCINNNMIVENVDTFFSGFWIQKKNIYLQ